jgi:hypothetical protein
MLEKLIGHGSVLEGRRSRIKAVKVLVSTH